MVDYTKWKDIEISDDEDETHPNIDTASLFRWRHTARVERMEQLEREKTEFLRRKETYKKSYYETSQALKEIKSEGKVDEHLEQMMKTLELERKNLEEFEKELKKKEQSTPWNVDTISQPGFNKTVVNSPKPRVAETLTEEEIQKRYKKFVKDNEKLIKHYGILRKYGDSKKYLTEYPQLVCDDTANYLVVWCINLEMEDKHELMTHVAHQTICMQYIMELSKHLSVHPEACISVFFSRMDLVDTDYKRQFDNEVEEYIKRISIRAQEKLDALVKEAEEEERAERLGPGGLDPIEVMAALPEELRACFESRDVQQLQDAIAKMDPREASYHMKRCVDSGLWVENANKAESASPSSSI